jgi:putative transposase
MIELISTVPRAPAALPVTRRCQVVALSRATYYRWRAAEPVPAPDVDLRVQIQALAMEMPAYGYRRVTHELRRRGLAVNHKRVVRLMREDNLLCLRKRGFVRTTDSAHPCVVYPHLGSVLIWLISLLDDACELMLIDEQAYLRIMHGRGP